MVGRVGLEPTCLSDLIYSQASHPIAQPTHLARLAGIEPASRGSNSLTLSIVLQAHGLFFGPARSSP